MAALSHSRAGSVNPPRVMEFDSKDAALAYRRLMEAEGWETVIERKGWGKWLVKLSNPPRLVGGNPAVSGKQYRLAQAVLGGANVEGMPREVAKEIVNRTPKELRSEYARGNPTLEQWVLAKAKIARVNVNNIRLVKARAQSILKEAQAQFGKLDDDKFHVLHHKITETIYDMADKRMKRNPEAESAAMYESFHGTPSSQVVEVEEEEHYHENLAELGVCCGVVVETVMGNVVAVGLSGYEWKGKGKDAGFVYTGEGERAENPDAWLKMTDGLSKGQADALANKLKAQDRKLRVLGSTGNYSAVEVRQTFERPSGKEYGVFVKMREENPLKSPWTVSRAAREAYAAGYAGKHQFADWVKLKRLDDRSSGFLNLIKQDYLRGLEDEHHDAQGKRATGRTRGVGSHEGYEIVRTEGGEYVAPKWDADSRFESLHLVKAAIDAHPNPKRGPIGGILHDSRSALFGAAGAVDRELGKAIGNPHDDVEPETTLLCSNEDGTQLYLVGGDQCLDLEGLGITGDMATKEEIVIGCVQQCWYETAKDFDKFKTIQYFHNLGEETGDLPELIYDRVNEGLRFAGGAYRIEKPLLETSAGIEN